jgi:soluble lytic murein transglycosylase-like protein
VSVFDIDTDGQRELEEAAALNPIDPTQIDPGFWRGAPKAIGMGVVRGGVKALDAMATAGSLLDVTSSQDPGREKQEARKQEAIAFKETLRKNALEYWTPKPEEVGTAGRVLGPFSEMALPLLLGGGNPALLLGSATLDTGKTMIDQGVDTRTAVASALLTDVTLAAGFKIPFIGKTVPGRMASGVAGNVAIGLPSREAQQAILESAGYTELAEQYDYNAEAFMLDALTGAAFGGLSILGMKKGGEAPAMKPEEVDALLAAKNAKHFQEDTAPGRPADAKASVEHQRALGDAIEQLLKGEPVNVAASITEADFIKAVPKETPITRAIAAAYPDLAPPKDLTALPLEQRQALRFNAPELDAYAATIEAKYGIPPGLINAIKNAGEKSNSNQTSPAGARGVMQFMPENLKKYGVTDPTDPVQMIDAAGRYLKDTLKQYKGDVQAVIADYNGGPRQANRVVAGEQPAAAETRAYLERVSKDLEERTGKGLERDTTLPPEQRDIEAVAYERTLKETPALIEQYFTKFKNVVDPDKVKELFPEFVRDPSLARAVHEPSSYLSKQIYAEALKRNEGKPVVFTAGGGGSGKTEAMPHAMRAAGLAGDPLTFDSTLSGFKSAVDKIDQARASGAKVVIVYTNRGVEDAFEFAMQRKRVVPISVLAKAHVGSSDTLRQLADHYKDAPDVAIHVVNNLTSLDQMHIAPIDNVFKYRYNDVERRLYEIAKQALDEGRISRTRYEDLAAGNGGKPEGGTRAVQEGQPGEDTGRPGAGAGGAPREQFGVGHYGAENIAMTERGMIVPARYAVTDIGGLVTSHLDDLRINPDFPAALQPRDRARAASEAQISRIENAINPELLGVSPKAGDGAPIVGADMVVESGNARMIALRRAYEGGKADNYRQWLMDNAERFGLDAAEIAKLEKPALVRVGQGDYNRAEFARQANESTVAQMSVTELAKADAERTPDLMGLVTNEDGSINPIQSAPFIQGFMSHVVSPSEHGTMMTADGMLSQQGLQRIRNAVFAKAYGDPDIVAMMAESTDANVRNVLAGMLRAAPAVARLKELIDAGARYPIDVTGDMVLAVRQFSQLKRDGMKVKDMLDQGALFDTGIRPEVQNLMIGLEENARAPKRVAELIGRTVDEIDRLGDPRQATMFGDIAQPTGAELVNAAIESIRRDFEVKPTADLFNSPEITAARQVLEQQPDLRTVMEDGREISVREAMKEVEDAQVIAKNDVKAFEAAVTCYMRNAA